MSLSHAHGNNIRLRASRSEELTVSHISEVPHQPIKTAKTRQRMIARQAHTKGEADAAHRDNPPRNDEEPSARRTDNEAAICATAFLMLLVAVLVGTDRAAEGKVDAPARVVPVEDTAPRAVEHGEGFLFGRVTTEAGTRTAALRP